MVTWAFIYVSKECDPTIHKATIDSPGFRCICIGVDQVDAACEVAKKIVAEGCQLIELCGAFDQNSTQKVIDATEGAVPVGFVSYFPGNEEKIKLIFG